MLTSNNMYTSFISEISSGTGDVSTGNMFLETEEFFSDDQGSSVILKEFTFDELNEATGGFSQRIPTSKENDLTIFLGWVKRNDQNELAPSKKGVGAAVAVTRITPKVPRLYNEWRAEVMFMGELKNDNFIRLLGYCRHGPQELLVYQHISKSFSSFIHDSIWNGLPKAFSWKLRLQIMIGVARGIVYLHSKNLLSHFNVRDIRIDEKFNAKISGFQWRRKGYSEARKRDEIIPLSGRFGFFESSYSVTTDRLLWENGDIFDFGMMLFETIKGRFARDIVPRRVSDDDDFLSFVNKAANINQDTTKLKEIMDPSLVESHVAEGFFKYTALAIRCIDENPVDRPSKEEILGTLENIYELSR